MLKIRRCQEEDLHFVLELQRLWEKEDITYGFVSASEEQLLDFLDGLFFVGEYNGSIVGFVYGVIRTSEGNAVMPKGEKYLEIEDIYIQPEFRDKGIGQELLDSVLGEAKSMGVERSLVYSSSKDWEQIVNFYKKNDFKMWYVQMYR